MPQPASRNSRSAPSSGGGAVSEHACQQRIVQARHFRRRRLLARQVGGQVSEGIAALREMSRGGRPPLLGAEELMQLQIALLEWPTAHGFGTPLWTLKPVRVFIERQFGVRYSDVHVWRLLGKMGFSSQKPERRALERDDAGIEEWKKHTWPALKKAPAKDG